ncbi:MAG: Smr/MutS family protein [Clostridia bacterium]|nr:Smr/MutS family protein [Clostridia bacterium]MDD4376437.1 Smr/MutS family protein [Clostridia bacterium]
MDINNEKKYCKLLNSNLIWEIVFIDDKFVIIQNENKIIKTSIDKIIIVKKDITKDSRSLPSFNTELYSRIDIPEIMLRHKTVDEAIYELDKFIDTCVISGFVRIKIIHGKSGGILRKAVHEYLNNCPVIEKYEIGNYHEGGLGVTIAFINKRRHID